MDVLVRIPSLRAARFQEENRFVVSQFQLSFSSLRRVARLDRIAAIDTRAAWLLNSRSPATLLLISTKRKR